MVLAKIAAAKIRLEEISLQPEREKVEMLLSFWTCLTATRIELRPASFDDSYVVQQGLRMLLIQMPPPMFSVAE